MPAVSAEIAEIDALLDEDSGDGEDAKLESNSGMSPPGDQSPHGTQKHRPHRSSSMSRHAEASRATVLDTNHTLESVSKSFAARIV